MSPPVTRHVSMWATEVGTERRVILGTLTVSSRRPLKYHAFVFCGQAPPPTAEALSRPAVRCAPWELHPPAAVSIRRRVNSCPL